jgi:hypothetical protein
MTLFVVAGLCALAFWVAGFVLLFLSLLGSDSLTREQLTGAREFRCGVVGLTPVPIYTSYPLAKLVIANDVVGVRMPAMGDYFIRRDQPHQISRAAGLLGGTIVIRSGKRRMRIKLSRRDVRRVVDVLGEQNWNHLIA